LSTPATPLKILYEDAFLLAVDKQPGLSVHPGSGTQGPTLAGALLASYPDLSGVGEQDRPGIVHRLDKDTSGALVIARTTEALESLKAAFAVRDVRKRYIAFVKGLPPKTGTIDAPIARHPVLRHRMSADLIDGKHAVTTWRVLRRFALSGVTLVSARLFTGRTHQARVHLASAGYPILGDSLYGSSNKSFFQSLPSLAPLVRRQLLHARRLSVPHPAGGRITFSAPWPEDFLAVYRELDQFETFYLR
jgi:23S rRNA pseudouridine1911/1915/1917 synthase